MLTDTAVFDPDYRPQRILHRDAELSQLSRALDPALAGDRGDDVLVHGPHGVGKTALVTDVLADLQDHPGIETASVECLGLRTAGVIRAVLQDLGVDVASNTPLEDCCLALRERVEKPTIVLLDEADDIPETKALRRLWDVDHVSVIAICHDEERWLSDLDVSCDYVHRPDVRVGLERYAPDELADILQPRARRGLAPGTVSREQLEAIADRAAGNAREAILTLHATATVAAERDQEAIHDADIPDGHERGLRWAREEALASLALHHQILYELIRQWGPLSGTELHRRYDQIAERVYQDLPTTPISRRARRYKLEKLDEYDLLDTEGPYEVVDDALSSPLDLSAELLAE